MDEIFSAKDALLKSIAAYSDNDPGTARYFWERLRAEDTHGNEPGLASAYTKLGDTAYRHLDYITAGDSYLQALQLYEELQDYGSAGLICHYMSFVAERSKQSINPKEWLMKAIDLRERASDNPGASASYNQLANILYKEGNLDSAEHWYRKSLDIDLQLADEASIAKTYHNLSAVAKEKKDISTAELLLLESLKIKKSLNDNAGIAIGYHQLGVLAEAGGSLQSAVEWYKHSIDINTSINNLYGVGKSQWNISLIFRSQGDTDAANKWAELSAKSLSKTRSTNALLQIGCKAYEIEEYDFANRIFQEALHYAQENEKADEQGRCYLHLGSVAVQCNKLDSAATCYLSALENFKAIGDVDHTAICCQNLGNIYLTEAKFNSDYANKAQEWFREAEAIRNSDPEHLN